MQCVGKFGIGRYCLAIFFDRSIVVAVEDLIEGGVIVMLGALARTFGVGGVVGHRMDLGDFSKPTSGRRQRDHPLIRLSSRTK